jgi:myo-inositol-1(or 4)-monophosphatase
MMDLEFYLSLATRAATDARNYLRESMQDIMVDDVSGKDTKIEQDRQSEAIIIDILQTNSDFPTLTEERGMIGRKDKKGYLWIVDPLDGTLNYLREIPFACVSIGLWVHDEPVLGVVYDVFREDLFTGVCGEGAWLNGQLVSVAETSQPNMAIMATGFPSLRSYEGDSLRGFIEQVQTFKKVRLFGAAALSLAYCAVGRVDAYAEEDIMFWDVAAGIALVKAAGGVVNYEKSDGVENGMNVFCAANPGLVEDRSN